MPLTSSQPTCGITRNESRGAALVPFGVPAGFSALNPPAVSATILLCGKTAMHPDVDRILKQVRDKTGYSATVVREESLPSQSSMKIASAKNPAHYIMVNPKYEHTANYLVTLQCAAILLKWSDPKRIPEFAVRVDALEAYAKRMIPEQHIPVDGKVYLLRHLLVQLASLPAELMSADWCYRECPALRDEQRLCMTAQLREASVVLSPKIRDLTPKVIFDRNAVMNSVLTLWWAQVEGSKVALLPYQALGFLKEGEELFGDFHSVPVGDPQRHPKVVDLWAARLDLMDGYHWQFRSE